MPGDIDTERAFELAEQYFGEIPGGEKPRASPGRRIGAAGNRLVLEDRVELPRIYMAWHSPAMFADGDAELDLLARSARQRQDVAPVSHAGLRQTHRARRLGVPAFARNRQLLPAGRDGGSGPVADRNRGRSSTSEIQRLSDEGPVDEEMERGLAQAEAHFMYRLQTVGGFGGKSDQLNAYNVLRGDPGFLRRRPRPLSQRRRANRCAPPRGNYLAFDRRVLLSIVPRGQAALALARLGAGRGLVMAVDRSRLPAAGARPGVSFPRDRPSHARATV